MSYYQQNNLETIAMINRKTVEILVQSNKFFKEYDMQWEELFNKPIQIISLQEAVIVGTAAILIKNPIISRRFWSG